MSLRLLAAASALALSGSAQDYAFNKATQGTLGQNLVFNYAGAPAGMPLLFMFSGNGGPFPLSAVSPGDPRSLDVGLDFLQFWFVLNTGTGSGSVPVPLPNDASLNGLALHFQTATLPGVVYLFDKLSNKVVAKFGLADQSTTLAATLGQSRALAAIVGNPNFNSGAGDLVLAGGGTGTLFGAAGLNTSEIYNFQTMSIRPGPTLTVARALSAAVRLTDGRLLIAGGVDNAGNCLSSAELYDPATNTFGPTGSMAVARAGHTATLLNDGRVLVVGGTSNFVDPVQALAQAQATAEIYNPATGTFASVRAMSARRLAAAATTLTDGRVIVTGGFQVNVLFGLPIPVGTVTSTEIYTVGSNTWAAGPAMRSSRFAHTFNTVRLPDGRVLITGGATSGIDPTTATPLAQAEYFNGAAWVALPDMAAARATHSVTVMPDGKVVVAGGAGGTIAAPVPTNLVQELDPASNTWRTLGNLQTARGGHTAGVTPDGLLVLFGGSAASTLSSIEVVHR